jgi:hypothetical protein
MSKNINVNPDHYKVAGRERQGEEVVHDVEKREVRRLRNDETRLREQDRPQGPAGRSRRSAQQPGLQVAGISNRSSAEAEARDAGRHPPVDTSSPPPEDAAGRVGEQPLDSRRDRQTSHKAGSRSTAQNKAGARYPDRSTPSSRKVAGAFGREEAARSGGSRSRKRSVKRK